MLWYERILKGHAKWITVMVITVVLLLAIQAPAAAQKPLTRVRLSEVVRSIFYAPQYVALSKGFFADEGLDIELSTAWGADKGAAALISGSVDIGFFGPEAAVYLYQQGASDFAVGFAQLTAMDGSFFMARHDNGNFQWEDLKGKIVLGGRRGGVPEMVLEWIIRQHGMEPHKDVRIITNLDFTATPGAFQAGTGEYIAQFEPTMTNMEEAGIGKIVASLGTDGGPITYTLYHARKRYLQENPAVIEAFTRALYRGMRWVAEHDIAEVAAEVAPFFPEVDRGVLIKALDRYRAQGTWNETPIISEAGYNHLLEVMMAAGELKQTVPFAQIMDNTIAQKVAAAGK